MRFSPSGDAAPAAGVLSADGAPAPDGARARACVLVFAGHDPSGGAGIGADIEAIAAQGAHALSVVTALTVQDNDRVFGVMPVAPALLEWQAQTLIDKIEIAAVKIGIPGGRANAAAIARVVARLRARWPALPVVLDPVLASGHGDALSRDDAIQALAPLLPLVTLLVPNLPEAAALAAAGDAGRPGADADAGRRELALKATVPAQAELLRARGCAHVLVTGGHADGDWVHNHWFGPGVERAWRWPRLPGQFHGSGCTLASAIAARLALGQDMAQALDGAQAYCQRALAEAYPIAAGQLMPRRAHN